MKCIHCGAVCEEQKGNLAWTSRDGIDVMITGSTFHSCPVCNAAILPPKVKAWLDRVLEEKRDMGGSPHLFLNVAFLAHS